MSLNQTIAELRQLVREAEGTGGSAGETPDQYKKRVGKCPQGYASDPETGKCSELPKGPAKKPDSEPSKGAEKPSDEPEGAEPSEPEKGAEKPAPPEDAAGMSPDELGKVKDTYDWGKKAAFLDLDDEQKDQIFSAAAEKHGIDPTELKSAFEKEAEQISDADLENFKSWTSEDPAEAFDRMSNGIKDHAKKKALDDGASEEEAEAAGEEAKESESGPFWKKLLGALVVGSPILAPLLLLTPVGGIVLAGGAVLALSSALGFKPKVKVADFSAGTPESPKPPPEPEEPEAEPKPKKKAKKKTPKPPSLGPDGPKGAKGAKGPKKRKPGRPKKPGSAARKVAKSKQTDVAKATDHGAPEVGREWVDRPLAAMLSEWSLDRPQRR